MPFAIHLLKDDTKPAIRPGVPMAFAFSKCKAHGS
jgi:hypothetical protein